MKERHKIVRLAVGFLCGIAFVIGCGDSTKTGGFVSAIGAAVVQGMNVLFNNAGTDLSSANVQEAIVEVNEKTNNVAEALQQLSSDIDLPGTCPTGMSKVLNQYCIDNTERAATFYINAQSTCYQEGKKLCDGSQWMLACHNSASYPGLTGMVGVTWEQVSDLQSNSGGVSYVLLMGKDSCYNSSHNNVIVSGTGYGFRCCMNP